MYTESSVELKNDFYTRYGQTTGELYFEKTGLPCILLESDCSMLAFSLGCGVRAYGRKYGDVLKLMNAGSDTSDVYFVKNGGGAQILYSTDIDGIYGIKETAAYTIRKLLRRMGSGADIPCDTNAAEICDIYGSKGWCAYENRGEFRQLPLPLKAYNALIIRTRKSCRPKADGVMLRRFYEGERKRITAAAEGLKRCRTDVLFSMMNESERAIEYLLPPSSSSVLAARAASQTDGVLAARICAQGVICFTDKEKTDSAVRAISDQYEHETGYSAGIIVAV